MREITRLLFLRRALRFGRGRYFWVLVDGFRFTSVFLPPWASVSSRHGKRCLAQSLLFYLPDVACCPLYRCHLFRFLTLGFPDVTRRALAGDQAEVDFTVVHIHGFNLHFHPIAQTVGLAAGFADQTLSDRSKR